VTGWGCGERQTAEAFERLLELSDAQVLKVLAVIAAEALAVGSGLAERVGERLQLDMRAFWQPDETFVELLTDKQALTRIAAELGAAPSGSATGNELRGLIRRRLNGEGCPPVENWLPRYFQFPTQGYTARPVSAARTAYDRLARCGSSATLEAEDEAAFEDEETAWRAEDADEAEVEWDAAAG
jgi:ParB family chromosome partitioning protein